MKITLYELLGMIKEGKAPKKIKYREMIYHICYEYGEYESDIEEYRFADIKEHYYLFEDIDMLKCLNDEVEIIEETQEHKIPEKLNISNFPRHNNSLKKTAIKINEILDYLEEIE